MPEPPSKNPALQRTTSSSGLAPESSSSSSATIRPRNRRPAASNSTSLLSTPSASPTRGASPIPSARIGSVTGRNNARAGSPAAFGSGGLGQGVSSWAAPTWSSLQGLASSFLGSGTTGGGADGSGDDRKSKGRAGGRKVARAAPGVGNGSAAGATWGPEPPDAKPRLGDVAAGSHLAEREARLRAMRTASVLQSHDGVNGGLDVSGRFKKRRSDEDLRGSAAQSEDTDEHLVYIHHVQPSDTYAGVVLRYRCREDAFRRANGLWSRDNTYIQARKWLALPVDACEIRGRPCGGAPSYYHSSSSGDVDLLAPTPEAATQVVDDPFSTRHTPEHQQTSQTFDEDRPWTHVRWVAIDNFPAPVEIARVPRKALGYFPPRRKKSLHTMSSLSTPRGSTDVPPSITLGSEVDHAQSPGGARSRRLSTLSAASRSVPGDLDNPHHPRPAWMRRPGGVGSLHGRVRGPERDYFNSWTRKHLPGLNIESLPSMSVMGSESARFGFDDGGDDAPGIVESPFEGDGLDGGGGNVSVSRSGGGGGVSGNGLDKAAAAVETWLRGAFAKMPAPGTPVLGPRGTHHQGAHQGSRQVEGDLIELTDTNSDDGRPVGGGGALGDLMDAGLLSSGVVGSSGRSEGDGGGGVRGRGVSSGKGKKAD